MLTIQEWSIAYASVTLLRLDKQICGCKCAHLSIM